MACFFILQTCLLSYSIFKNAAVRKLVTLKNSLQPIFLLYISIFVLKTIFFIIVGIYTIETAHRDGNLMILTRQLTYYMDIILSSIYFGFLYKMRLVQIQMNEDGKQPSEVYKQLVFANRMVKFTIVAYLCAGSTYTFFFTILEKTGVYSKVPGLEYTFTIITLIVCVPFDILQVILCIYFIKLGCFITRLLKLD